MHKTYKGQSGGFAFASKLNKNKNESHWNFYDSKQYATLCKCTSRAVKPRHLILQVNCFVAIFHSWHILQK